GLENRLISMIKDAHSFKDLLTKVKTKRYTYTHIQRVLMNVLLNIEQCDIKHDISAARILGMNENGRAYLKYLKRHFPERHFITNINQSSSAYFSNEIKATHIYNLMSQQFDDDFNTPVIKI
ncbi:nucleotidyltransferase, partial [Pseudomonas aeruginosa]